MPTLTADYSLFNASDEWILPYVPDTVFDESLVLNILFQDRILMHESYFFNSSLLAHHIERAKHEVSLFEHAARRGFVIPAIRSTTAATFREAFQELCERQYAPGFQLVIRELKDRVHDIVAHVDAGLATKGLQPFRWPPANTPETNVGIQYHEMLRRLFCRDDLPLDQARLSDERLQVLDRVWEASQPWRLDCIEEAHKNTVANNNPGIQRVEIMRALGWHLGVPRSEKTVTYPMILEAIGQHDEETAEKRMTLEIFVKWMAQCHHLTQARIFGTSINFPVYDLEEDYILDSLFVSSKDAGDDPAQADRFSCVVQLPPMRALVVLQSAELVAIRDDLGEGYRAALRKWQLHPTEVNREEAIACLKGYCERIAKRYESRFLKPLVATFCHSAQTNILDLASQGMETFGAPEPVGWSLSAAKNVTTVYQYITARKTRASLMPSNRQLDITLNRTTTIEQIIGGRETI